MGALLALALAALCLPAASDFDGRWRRHTVSSIGLCRYGGRIDCCWGWVRQSWGRCQPVCQPACKHGECVGPNKCKCHPGYAGKTCNQDLNECGLQPRPCKHRCMNTWGSFKCYCPSGYMRMPDGSCSGALTCSLANCQYDCDVVKGQVRCQCPSPGLQLAPDGRTCMDIDECALGRASCPPFRQCVNTFGSYVCKCQDGLDLVYIGGKYQCHDIPRVLVEPSGPIPGPKGNGSVSKGDGGQSNRIPDVGRTQWPPRTPYIPLATIPTSRPTAKPTAPPTPTPTPRPTPRHTSRPTPPPPPPLPTHPRTPPPPPPTTGRPTPRMSTAAPATTVPATTFPGGGTMDNRIHTDPQKPRGDVFIPRQPSNDLFEIFEIERGISADDTAEGAKDDPGILIHSCNFDHGLCGWIREKDSDLHWEPALDPAGAAADPRDPGGGRVGTDGRRRLETHTHHPAGEPRPERHLQGREAARAPRDGGAGRREPDPRTLHPGPPPAPALMLPASALPRHPGPSASPGGLTLLEPLMPHQPPLASPSSSSSSFSSAGSGPSAHCGGPHSTREGV